MIPEIESKGVAVKLLVSPLIVKDNLERMGIVNRKEKKLFPSCYLIEQDGQHFICHFKDLLKVAGSDDSDKKRRNTIVWLLSKWGLISTAVVFSSDEIQKKKLFILTREQKETEDWNIQHKFHYNKNKKTTIMEGE